ncbi:MAG: EVE domain-containing protein [Gammaproteobacteria bacterium]
MNYWLLKSEPSTFSIGDLRQAKDGRDHWDGVRNYQARNFIRDMKQGDQAFFYHSNCPQPGIVGIVDICRAAYPDFTAYDPDSTYYDPKSDPDNPRWYMMDVRYQCKFTRLIGLAELKRHDALQALPLVRRGNRLSIMPVAEMEWHFILQLADQ